MATDPILLATIERMRQDANYLSDYFKEPRETPPPIPANVLELARRIRDASQMQTSSAMRYPVALFKELNTALRALDAGENG